MHRALHAISVGLALAVATFEGHVDASTSLAVTFDALLGASTAAATVTPMTQMSVWEGGRIVTYTEVHVDELIAAKNLPDDVWVRSLGGDVGRLTQLVEGEARFTLGRPSLVFLHPTSSGPYAVTARGQGQLAVVRDPEGALRLHQGAREDGLLKPSPLPASPFAIEVLDGASVDEAVTTVR